MNLARTESTILTCAVSGATLSGNPHQPTTPERIIEDTLRAAEAGASIVHIHARTKDGRITQATQSYAAVKQAIRAAGCDVLLNFSTTGEVGTPFDERSEPLAAEPELASLNAGSLNFGLSGEVHSNPGWFIAQLGAEMHDRAILPDYECFDIGMAVTAAALAEDASPSGIMHFVMGVAGGAPPLIELMCHFALLVPAGVPWMATAIGRNNFPMMAAVLARGGHIRTGLEDVMWDSPGVYATNEGLVRRAVALSSAVGRPVATPREAAEMLGIG